MILPKQLKLILKQRDMTAAQLSRQCGLPRQTISDWLSGSNPKDISQVKKAADALSVSVDFLCFGTDSAHNDPTDKTVSVDSLLGDQWISGVYEIRLRRVKK